MPRGRDLVGQNNSNSKITIQIQLPSKTNNHDTPTMVLYEESDTGEVKSTTYTTLDVMFNQIADTYSNDKEALHRFSYYLLMQAKEFAQGELSSQESASLNIVSTD